MVSWRTICVARRCKPCPKKCSISGASNECTAFSDTSLYQQDGTIVGVATPEITTDLGNLGDVGWLGSAYFLSAAASQLVFGALNRVVAHKHVYICGIFLFELGCLLAGLATTSTMCIVGRAFSGLGCSGVVSTSLVCDKPSLVSKPLHQANVCVPPGL
ncbi:rubrofusarin-specific efflux pump aurT [Colletotrichum liriopes]|uniref:Rubrofusarin-specific efflux pump aurT n=1 Tax=Colletotrichum liriopes TaxID=708192 RepID=A0AA37GSG4_9PEZI|nr:rubrofusarin-specific efflux pump aurT [Colletotrichum liriopes]